MLNGVDDFVSPCSYVIFSVILNLLHCPGSDILYLNLCGSSMIVLNSVRVTNDLLEKRSAIYSER